MLFFRGESVYMHYTAARTNTQAKLQLPYLTTQVCVHETDWLSAEKLRERHELTEKNDAK